MLLQQSRKTGNHIFVSNYDPSEFWLSANPSSTMANSHTMSFTGWPIGSTTITRRVIIGLAIAVTEGLGRRQDN
jgi:hypothetical protein